MIFTCNETRGSPNRTFWLQIWASISSYLCQTILGHSVLILEWMCWVSWSDIIRTWGSDLTHSRCLENISDRCHPNATGRWDLLSKPTSWSQIFFCLLQCTNSVEPFWMDSTFSSYLLASAQRLAQAIYDWLPLALVTAGGGGRRWPTLLLGSDSFLFPDPLCSDMWEDQCRMPTEQNKKAATKHLGTTASLSPVQPLLTSEQASEA